jgi:flagellar export protein FliJ
MKTKFDSIVKIKKQNVQNIERNIQKINSSIHRLNEKIKHLTRELLSFSLPKSGTFSEINQLKQMQYLLKDEIENLKNQIEILNSRKKDLLEELKKANIEYEKMKYLQNEELKKKLKEISLKESREMDEIAILLRDRNEKG